MKTNLILIALSIFSFFAPIELCAIILMGIIFLDTLVKLISIKKIACVDGKKYRNTSSIINCSWWIRDYYSSVYRWTRWSGGRYIVDPTIFYEESRKYKFLKVYVDKENPYLPCLIVDNKFEFK